MTSSSPSFSLTSPISPAARRARRSRFTYKQLSTFSQCSPSSPLRVIAHIDLDAFYAQCETVRLGLDPSHPLAVQQWQGLIAINYPARAHGLNRHVTVTEAKEKCPEIVCQHVATWKEGDTKWSYAGPGEEPFKEIAVRKVSLDPYRIQSRAILKLIKDMLPNDLQKVEKASIDEVFLDLSAHVHSILLERFPELRGPPPYDDPSEPLPRPPTTVLDWQADALIDLNGSQSEEEDPDWDDICMLIGSEIVRDVRKKVFEELHYTCSAGLSRNKMIAKLGSGHKKPNSQTIIRNRAVSQFLSDFKFTKIRNLGGKLGDEVVAAFNTDQVSELLTVPLEQLKKQIGDDTGSWLYNTIRGEDHSEVNPRTQIKSMLSAKSFRPSVNSMDVACKWLRIFVADIFSRLVEEGVLENKRRPKTINLHHRQGAQTKSKQAPIPLGKTISEDALFDLAKNLLAQVVVDGRAWPCANLSLSVGGFEDGIKDNKGIGGFLVRGDEAKALNASITREDSNEGLSRPSTPPPNKKRRVADSSEGGIAKFFGAVPARHERTHDDKSNGRSVTDRLALNNEAPVEDRDANRLDNELPEEIPASPVLRRVSFERPDSSEHTNSPSKYLSPFSSPSDQQVENQHISDAPLRKGKRPFFEMGPSPEPEHLPGTEVEMIECNRCRQQIPLDEQAEHSDFHFAQDLQNQHSSPPQSPPKPIPPENTSRARPQRRPRGRGRPPAVVSGAAEKGQRKLAFG
ncbi:DNA/RNA polymerase [Polychaeton citri CBS 116435]|uniref:DNA polymerase eta n=1 Tax=Polychaeton citri CBS 116435 TaxID=1314669 RepID=A0A9P4UU21_9PEZI|nr:DNA/RNA polymerase [Polychaeton citri CBS 116435]